MSGGNSVQLSFRWYGQADNISLGEIRQIPGVTGIVSSLHEQPVGAVWPLSDITALRQQVEAAGLKLTVIESVPVHESIKMGLPARDGYIKNYQQTLRHLAEAGIDTVCYNFMPLFDWLRTTLAYPLADGSTTLAYDDAAVDTDALLDGRLNLPAWNLSTQREELKRMLVFYQALPASTLWDNLAVFVRAVMPVAEECGIRMALHPDDPPWPVAGIPRIVVDEVSLRRILEMYAGPCHGLCFCSGSLGASAHNDLPGMIRQFGKMGRIHFVHLRNVKRTAPRGFYESGHRSADGSLDMADLVSAFEDVGYHGPVRPDHGRMIWGESGHPGYGLFDRALGATYLAGLWEGVRTRARG